MGGAAMLGPVGAGLPDRWAPAVQTAGAGHRAGRPSGRLTARLAARRPGAGAARSVGR